VRRTILVVEDDHARRDVLMRGLREEGFGAVPAPDGATALRPATADICAAVLDIGLPDADGRDVCQAMRANGFLSPVIFLTAHHRLPDRLSGFSAGGDDYLTKPFHVTELAARLRAARPEGVQVHDNPWPATASSTRRTTNCAPAPPPSRRPSTPAARRYASWNLPRRTPSEAVSPTPVVSTDDPEVDGHLRHLARHVSGVARMPVVSEVRCPRLSRPERNLNTMADGLVTDARRVYRAQLRDTHDPRCPPERRPAGFSTAVRREALLVRVANRD
jgi:CheY-like chemotaxis protein